MSNDFFVMFIIKRPVAEQNGPPYMNGHPPPAQFRQNAGSPSRATGESTLQMPNTTKADFANTVAPGDTAYNEPSHQHLKCLPIIFRQIVGSPSIETAKFR